ncbi:epoxyqueuosine reductase [Ruminococcus sp.]|uniref:epoxyqueuosine reductase n=1 Tax=Ruminococcus sp. TaxID=41978 RepID=UPI0025F40003|nr:epoxyqueuosine reductase [Ruminococcus sp.]
MTLEQEISKLFAVYPQVLYGYAGTAYCEFGQKYPSVLVFAVPYSKQLTLLNYKEPDFEQGIQDARAVLEEILEQLERILRASGTAYEIPPVGRKSEAELEALFSFKFAAVNAGLGWIGKNDVVITEQYGPRVRLSAVFIDAVMPYGTSVTKSKCPDSCRKCVDICPCKALHNVSWDIETWRSDIIDYEACNQKRSQYIETHGRMNSCGLCLVVCPFGTKQQ